MSPQSVNILDSDDPLAYVGQTVGVSSWILVDQPMISQFARVTKDWDKMHVDPEWCRAHSPYGMTIGFGFLTLSLLTAMVNEVSARPHDEVATYNFGFNRLRIIHPVLVDQRIRTHFTLNELSARRPGRYQFTYGLKVEIEGEEKPAMIGDWLSVTDTAAPRPTVDAAAMAAAG